MISEYKKSMCLYENLTEAKPVSAAKRKALGDARRANLWLVTTNANGISYYAPPEDLAEHPSDAYAGKTHWALKPGHHASWKIENDHLVKIPPAEIGTTPMGKDPNAGPKPQQAPKKDIPPQQRQSPSSYRGSKERAIDSSIEVGNKYPAENDVPTTAARIKNPTSKNDPFNWFSPEDRDEISRLFTSVTAPQDEADKETALKVLINRYHFQFSQQKDGLGVTFQTPDKSQIATFPPSRSISVHLSRLGPDAAPRSYSFKPQQMLYSNGTFIKTNAATEDTTKISVNVGDFQLSADAQPTQDKLEALLRKSAPQLSSKGIDHAMAVMYPVYELHSKQMEAVQKMFRNGKLYGKAYGGQLADAAAMIGDLSSTIQSMNITGGNEEETPAHLEHKAKVTTILDGFLAIRNDEKFEEAFNDQHRKFMKEVTSHRDAIKDNLSDICETLSMLKDTLKGDIVLVPYDPNFPNIDYVAITPDMKNHKINFENSVSGLKLTEVSVENLHDIELPSNLGIRLASVKKDEGAAGKQIDRVKVTAFKGSKQLGLSPMDVKRDLSYVGEDGISYFDPITKKWEQSFLDLIKARDSEGFAATRIRDMYNKYAIALLTYSDMVDDDDLLAIANGDDRLKNKHMDRLLARITGKDPIMKGRAIIPRPRVRSATGTPLPKDTHLHHAFGVYMLGAFFSEAVYNSFTDHQGFVNQRHDAKNGGIDETDGNIPPDDENASLALVNISPPDGTKFIPYKGRLVNTKLRNPKMHKRITGLSSDYRNNRLIENLIHLILR